MKILLLNRDADGSLESEEGKTAFDYSEENRYPKETDIYWEFNDTQFN